MDQAEQIIETDAEDMYFALSPDETQLAYVESHRDLGRLAIRTLSDGSDRELTRGQRLREIAWSPDGQTLAFIGSYRGQAHVWTVPTTGGMPTVLERALASEDAPMAWAPGERLLYEHPDFSNFGVLDPESKADRPLITDAVEGFPFFPAVSPDGDSVAVLWTREPLGVWIIDIERGTSRLLVEGEYYPMRWSQDGRFVYAGAVAGDSKMAYHRLPTDAGTQNAPVEPWRIVDFGGRRTSTCQLTSTEVLLCAVVETTDDIWISEAIE